MKAECRGGSSGAFSSVVWSTLRWPASRRSALQKHNTRRSRRPWSVWQEESWWFGSTQRSSMTSPHHDQQGFAFLETGTLRRGGSCATTQVGADAGAEPCTSCAADHGVVGEVTCGTARHTRGKRGNFSWCQSLGGTVGGGFARA